MAENVSGYVAAFIEKLDLLLVCLIICRIGTNAVTFNRQHVPDASANTKSIDTCDVTNTIYAIQ